MTSIPTVLFQPINDGSTVFDETSVWPNPDLDDATFSPAVITPQAPTNQIRVAVQSNHAPIEVILVLGVRREMADRLAVFSLTVFELLKKFMLLVRLEVD